jgi:hypothetical protein
LALLLSIRKIVRLPSETRTRPDVTLSYWNQTVVQAEKISRFIVKKIEGVRKGKRKVLTRGLIIEINLVRD